MTEKNSKCEVSPGVDEILKEVSKIIGSSYELESDRTISSLESLSKDQFNGKINDIASIAKSFLESPSEEIPVEDLVLENPDKKVGKFFVKDLSDNPSLDITKVIDLNASEVSSLDSLKFSISVKGMEAVKSLNLGGKSLKIKFLISKKGFSYLPVLDNGVVDRETAIEKLKDSKVSLPVSSSTNFQKARSIALNSYSSKEVQSIVNSSKDTVELVNRLGSLGIVLFEEIDVTEEVLRVISEADTSESIPVYDEEDCGTPQVSTSSFSSDEIKEIEKDCCGELESEIESEQLNKEDSQLEIPIIDEIFPEEKDLEKVKKFINDVENSSSVIQSCAIEKQNALNSYYWYIEAKFLNEIALEYAFSRANMIDALVGNFSTMQEERTRKIEESNRLKQEENRLILETYQRIFGINLNSNLENEESLENLIETSSGRNIGGVFISQTKINQIENDFLFKTSVSSIRDSFQENELSIINLTNKIEDSKRFFELPTFTESEILNLQTINPLLDTSILASKTRVFKEKFLSEANPISNQVGFNEDLRLELKVHPYIAEEASTLFSLTSPEKGDVENYINLLSIRSGTVAQQVWNKFYSSRRIDLLFTHTEQGFNSPKPLYDDEGNLIGQTKKIKIADNLGKEIEQEVSSDLLNLEVNAETALEFWPNLEIKTKEKIDLMLKEVKSSDTYLNYLKLIKAAGENEAKYAYAANLIYQEASFSSREFNTYTNSFNFNQSFINSTVVANLNNSNLANTFKSSYRIVYDSISGFHKSINTKLDSILDFIEVKKKCISDQEQNIIDKSINLSDSTGPSSPTKEDCASKLGSDPFGLRLPGNCPGIVKNCYWAEYTKLMQLISVMPIPDDASTGQLTKRLFRYYPVGIQIPVPSPAPIVLPTLASGIPDILISIPLPLVWKHIITLTTPLGMFVVWIALCGPIPSPYVMFIDENVDPCFLVTAKGPIDIPAKSLKISNFDDKSLLEILPSFKLPALSSPLFGSDKIKNDPDDASNIIDKIQEKIKASVASLEEKDPWTLNGETATQVRELKNRVSKAFDNFPPDIDAIQTVLNKVENAISSMVDSINISSVKFPKDPEKLINPLIGPVEFLDSFNKLLDSGTDLPSIGLGIPTISLREKVKVLIDRDLSSSEVKSKFFESNQKIANLEAKLRISSEKSDDEKIRERVKLLKEVIKAPVDSLASKITPEMLGFVAVVSFPLPLPFPCYDNNSLEPLPPYILALLAAIRNLPNAIDNVSEDKLANAISKFINLSAPLPRVEDMIFFLNQAFLSFVPDLKFPDPSSATIFKQILLSSVQNFFKLKLRLPKPGTLQITIPSSLIKSVLKKAIIATISGIVATSLKSINEATLDGNYGKALAVAVVLKGVFGTDLSNISGEDLKAFILSSLETVNDFLGDIKKLLVSFPKFELKSIKEQLFPTIPPKIFSKDLFVEVDSSGLVQATFPLLRVLEEKPIPYPLVLLAASQLPGRAAITKIYPFAAKEILPSWEKMSLSNLPFVIWLDQLIATAQKQGGIASNYIAPYYLVDA